MLVDIIVKIIKEVVIETMVLVHVSEIVLNVMNKVCEQHLVMNKHTIVKEGIYKSLQLFPVGEVIDLLVQVALQQLVELVCSDWLSGFVKHTHGLLICTVKNARAASWLELVTISWGVLIISRPSRAVVAMKQVTFEWVFLVWPPRSVPPRLLCVLPIFSLVKAPCLVEDGRR